MSLPPQSSALMMYLKEHDTETVYYGKILELREQVTRWLSYVPESFPHYTQHTVEHSDTIVIELGKLLFRDDDPGQPVVPLSVLEAYIVIAAAYLHDTGMVVANQEKAEILASDAWKAWTTVGGGAKRWAEINEFREHGAPSDSSVRNFLADLQTRYLIAEFVRRDHHRRAATLMEQHQSLLGRFAFDNAMLLRTIADVCVAHGLEQAELNDRAKYPDQRDIRGHKVNVRFAAILLRIGDLLDMSVDRACPLLLNAASPLPHDSLPRWTKYQAIVHRATSPDRIELRAECKTQEEHRFLQDWCQWLVDEVRNAGVVMPRCARHNGWKPPDATLRDSNPTIVIEPAPSARYFPSNWTMQLDQKIIFERLIYDLYSSPQSFIRELIQNALDANRSKMELDLRASGVEIPVHPTRVEQAQRERYPLWVRLEEREVENQLSGEMEKRQVLIVEDVGIGMDKEIIQNFLLQVGRSYYTTDEFRRKFHFAASSRFGLGFLSVFAVSDHVCIETYKPSTGGEPIRLVLTGPRNYLLTERGQRHSSGTRVEVRLHETLPRGELTQLVAAWCRRVEFPIHVHDLGEETTITSESAEQFIKEVPDITKDDAKFLIRAFPIETDDIEGEIYVLAYIDKRGESWAEVSWAQTIYENMHPQARAPRLPGNIVCFRGISVDRASPFLDDAFSTRLDYRGEPVSLVLSRESIHQKGFGRWGVGAQEWANPVVKAQMERLLRNHLATSDRANSESGWKYKQKLSSEFTTLTQFWESVPDAIRVYEEGMPHLRSLKEILVTDAFWSTYNEAGNDSSGGKQEPYTITQEIEETAGTPILLMRDIIELSDTYRQLIFTNRTVSRLRRLPSGQVAILWIYGSPKVLNTDATKRIIEVVSFPDDTLIGVKIHKTKDTIFAHILVNERARFVKWLLRLREACTQREYGLQTRQYEQLLHLLDAPLRYGGHELEPLVKYLQAWNQIAELPQELHAPIEDLDSLKPRYYTRTKRTKSSKK